MSLSVLIFPSEIDGILIAACMEKYVVIQAKTVRDAHYQIEHCLATYALLDKGEGVEPLSRIEPPPAYLTDAWHEALPMGAEFEVPEFSFERGGENIPITETLGSREYRWLDYQPGKVGAP